jgi:hypothetical protein
MRPWFNLSCIIKGWSPLDRQDKDSLQSGTILQAGRMYAHRSRDVKVTKETCESAVSIISLHAVRRVEDPRKVAM